MNISDDERRSSSQLELIQHQILNCINSNDRPQKIKALIDSWRRVRDQTMACSKEIMILSEPSVAARKREGHDYLDSVEGNSKTTHSKSLHFEDSFRQIFAGSIISPSDAEKTLMMSEGDF